MSSRTTLEYLDHHPAAHPAGTFDPEQQIKN
jgi:hypothetical protein